MEIVASVSAGVPVATLLAEKVLKYIDERADKSQSKELVEQLKAWLSKFQSIIKDHERNHHRQYQNHVTKDFVNKIANVTAVIEDALDEFMFAVPAVEYHRGDALKDRRHASKLSKRRDEIKAAIDRDKLLDHHYAESSTGNIAERYCADPLTHQFLVEDGIVGFKKRKEDLAMQLKVGDAKRMTIEVVGPGGSGKSFLVKNVCAEVIRSHFDCGAWMKVSRYFDYDVGGSEKIWQEDLFWQVCSVEDRQSFDREAGNTVQQLRRYLEKRKYLIVLDDVWNKQDYASILNLLPNGETRSRIVITSRKSYVVDNPDYTHKLDGLIEEEAWELFCLRAFGNLQRNAFPPQLKEVSNKIIKKCDNLPLAVAAAGSWLSKKSSNVQADWDSFFQSLGSELGSHSNLPIVSRILQPSFVDLPDHLRSCFMYFGIFREGEAVSSGRLIRSWMAEGFLEEIEGKKPEEVAESYMNELIERSLVRASASEIDGRVRSCQVLRLHHMFIAPLLKEGNFVTVKDEKSVLPCPNVKVRRLSIQHDGFLKTLSHLKISDWLRYVRTLFVFSKLNVLAKNRSIRSALKSKFNRTEDDGYENHDCSEQTSSIRSAIKNKINGNGDDDLEKIFSKFKLLKVLDFQGVPLHQLPKAVGSFVLLKCLNLRGTKVKTIPNSVQKLILLETLDLKHTRVRKLPKFINKLKNLRHLLVSSHNDSSNIAQGATISSDGIGSLSYLQTLSIIQVNINHQVLLQDLENLAEIRKLGLVDLNEDFGHKLCKSIEKMENMAKFNVRAKTGKYLELDNMERPPKYIQRLHLNGRLRSLPRWISLLLSLVKVVLKGSKVSPEVENPLACLEALPSLKDLQMVDYYIGEMMLFKEGTFVSLMKLHVEQFDNLTLAIVEHQALPKLKSLTICKCQKLQPLPDTYPLRQLEELVVYDMNDAFISGLERRIDSGELVDHVQDDTASLSTNQGVRRQIRSFRHVS